MNQAEFKKMFDGHKETARTTDFRRPNYSWDDQVRKWREYYDLIIGVDGLDIDRWLKCDQGYLPDFLEKKERNFGHARPGMMGQNMIYYHTGGKDEKKKNKYYDAYAKKEYFDSKDKVEKDYKDNIQTLLQDLVGAKTIDEVYVCEKSEAYKKYQAKQILRKISILMSVMDDCPYKNAFVWIFDEKAIKTLGELLDVDYDDESTFLKNNHDVYEKAKQYAGLTSNPTKEECIKLYDFLWNLTSTTFNTTELSDFRNINIIFNGAPGTGKTYGVTKGIEKLQSMDPDRFKKESRYIQFHPSFTYQDFIEGFKPVGITDGQLDLKVVNGCFKDFCIFVKKQNEAYYSSLSEKPKIDKPSDFENWPHYYFVVDEINRGNLSSIFGETFTLLEKSYRDYDFSGDYSQLTSSLVSTTLSAVISKLGEEDLVYKKLRDGTVCFGIPFNIHFIGMMNDVDRSIDAFDLALRRRFKWIPKYCDYDVIETELSLAKYSDEQVEKYVEDCKSLNGFICASEENGLNLGKTYEIGHSFFLKILDMPGQKRITKTKKEEIFTNYIYGTLKEYLRQLEDDSKIDGFINEAKKRFGLD